MTDPSPASSPQFSAQFSPMLAARATGVLYLIIIVTGIWVEVFVRGSMIVSGDVDATAANFIAQQGFFRIGFAAETLMALADVGVAILLYLLLKPVNKTVALLAAAFHLVQSAVMSLNMLNAYGALMLLTGPAYGAAFEPAQLNALASFFISMHGHGYSLALIFFGVNCLLLGVLIVRARFLPSFIGVLMFAAGLVYIFTAETRFLVPESYGAVTPLFVVCLVAELSICLWLLIRGVNVAKWG